MAKQKQGRLGRNLGLAPFETVASSGGATHIPIDHIRPNPHQPRRIFHTESIEELAVSIRAKGMIQPIVLRRDPKQSNQYQIIAGERRWRAAQAAELKTVPAIVTEHTDRDVLEIAIIENVQREDLDPMAEATAYQHLMQEFGHTQDQVSEIVGKSRSHVANLLRLLNLPGEVKELVRSGRISAGHARALLPSADPESLAEQILSSNLTVRETEQLVRRQSKPSPVPPPDRPPALAELERDLSKKLKLPTSVRLNRDGSARMVLKFSSMDELERLVVRLTGAAIKGKY